MRKSILVFGDSITWGKGDYEGGWVARLKREFDKNMIDSDYDEMTEVYNLGISGDYVADVVNRMSAEISARVDPGDPEFTIVIAVGINDSQVEMKSGNSVTGQESFLTGFEKILTTAQQVAKRVICVGLTPVDETKTYPRPNKPDYGYLNKNVIFCDALIKNLCVKRAVTFVDVYPSFAEAMKEQQLLSDGLHPNDVGHELIYQLVRKSLA